MPRPPGGRCCVEGDPAVGADPLVVELRAEPTIAAGESDHGLGELLGAETIRLREGDSMPPLDSGRSVVLVLRDAHRHPWQRELVVPGAVVVETGVPEWRPEAARAFVVTNGPGRANLAAAAGGAPQLALPREARPRLGRHGHRAGHARLVLAALRRRRGLRARRGRARRRAG